MSKSNSVPDSSQASRRAISDQEMHDAVRKRAEEIYIRNGRIPGRDLENWADAELEVMQEIEKAQWCAAVIVDVNGVKYVGEYDPIACDGYKPGEFSQGAPVPVRFHGDKMFVKRPNGRELETTIVEKRG